MGPDGVVILTLFLPNSTIPQQIQNTYDGAGRLAAAITMVMGAEAWRTTTAYGGDHTDVTPPAGATATTTYTDARGRTTELRQYHGPTPTGTYDTTTYGYSPAGNLTSLTDAAGNSWSWTFDLLGNQLEAVDPDTGTTTKTYDNAGRLLTTTDARPVTIAYSYDELDRKTGVYEGSTSGTHLASWTYDTLANGTLTKSTRYVDTPSGTDAYVTAIDGYDTGGRPTGTTVTIPASQSGLAGTYTNTFTYGANGELLSHTTPAVGGLPAETLHSSFDSLGQPIRLSSTDGTNQIYAGTTVYTHLNQLAQFKVTQGLNFLGRTYYYADGTGRLTRALTTMRGQAAADRAFTYNQAGNVTSIEDTPEPNPTDTQCFAYDHLQRITEAWTPSTSDCAAAPSSAELGGPAPYWQSYTYDVTGNRTSMTHHAKSDGGATTTDTYTYPAAGQPHPHAVQSVTHQVTGSETLPPTADTFSYDNAGNTTNATLNGTPQTFTYDSQGRLDTATTSGQVQSNIYDADGNLLIRTEPGRRTLYVGDTEVHVNGTAQMSGTRTYTFAGRPVAERVTQPGSATSKVQWLDSDLVSTATVAQDSATGTVIRRHSDPFGNPRDPAAVTWPTNHGFLNKPTSDLSALTHLGAREYNPKIGRFITVDSILDSSDPQQLNGYSYANNSPITKSDPTGLLLCNGPDGIGCQYYGYGSEGPKAPIVEQPPKGIPEVDYCNSYCQWKYKQTRYLKNKGWLPKPPPPPKPTPRPCEGLKFCAPSSGSVANDITPEEFWSGIGAFAYEVSGAADAVECVTEGSLSGCLWTAFTILTLGLGAGLRLAGKTLEAGTTAGAAANVVAHACSFTGETKVLMADGSQKPISDIGVGDSVLATDPETRETRGKVVTEVFVHQDTVVGLQLASGVVLTTEDHPFWNTTKGVFETTVELDRGDSLLSASGQAVAVLGIGVGVQKLALAYNLEVATTHTYYVVVGDQTVLVHNGGLPGTCGVPPLAGLGSTGRTVPANLKEQLAMQQAMSSPGAGFQMNLVMADSRWPAAAGWVKMSQNVNGVEVHYVMNTVTGAIDDFKFK